MEASSTEAPLSKDETKTEEEQPKTSNFETALVVDKKPHTDKEALVLKEFEENDNKVDDNVALKPAAESNEMHEMSDSDDFQKKDKPKKKSTPPEKLKKAPSTDDTDIEVPTIKKADNSTEKKKKKKPLNFSDSENEADSFSDHKNAKTDEENDDNDDDDDDFKKKKKPKKTASKKKTSPDEKDKVLTKKKSEKENNAPIITTKSMLPTKSITTDVSKVAQEQSHVTTPFTSKVSKPSSFASNSTSTPNASALPVEKNSLNPVNKFLAHNNLLNKSATAASSSPLGRIEIKTPSPFARVGLSRNSKVKPLHPNAKLT